MKSQRRLGAAGWRTARASRLDRGAARFARAQSALTPETLAATYPARTSALVLYGTFARMLRAPDYPIGLPAEMLRRFLELIGESWVPAPSLE